MSEPPQGGRTPEQQAALDAAVEEFLSDDPERAQAVVDSVTKFSRERQEKKKGTRD